MIGYGTHSDSWWKKHAHPGSLTVVIRVLCWDQNGQQASELHQDFDSLREAKAYAKRNVEYGGKRSTVELRVEGWQVSPTSGGWGSVSAVDYGMFEAKEES